MATPERDTTPSEPRPALQAITERLDSLARELDSEPDDQRAAELVREVSELATKAGREVERALRAAQAGE